MMRQNGSAVAPDTDDGKGTLSSHGPIPPEYEGDTDDGDDEPLVQLQTGGADDPERFPARRNSGPGSIVSDVAGALLKPAILGRFS